VNRWRIAALLGGAVAGCGSATLVEDAGGGGGAGASSSSSASATGTGGSGDCSGARVWCAAGCGADYFPAQADCVDGDWVCPEGTIDPADCPDDTCWGLPLPCEVCGPSGWECAPEPVCIGSCGGLLCAECPADGGPAVVGGCACACDSSGVFSCDLAPGCCNADADCGGAAVCVASVCKAASPEGCWSDAQCPPGLTCEGESVCSCGVVCGGPDAPGKCQ
jgi:hypothetical protein